MHSNLTLWPIRYFVRVSISRRMADVSKEKDIWVHSFRMPPDSNNSIKMEVGIEDCLHIEFEYNKSKWVHPIRDNCVTKLEKIPLEGCYCWEDLLPIGAYKDQAHGTVHYPPRDNGLTTESIQRKRNHHEIRNHGWCSSARYVFVSVPMKGELTFVLRGNNSD